MLDILTIVHGFADIQTASRIRRVCRRLAVLTPEPTLYNNPKLGVMYEYRVGNKLHRLDGPARAHIFGYIDWYRGGVYHREYHPQCFYPTHTEYKVEGVYHREAGPSIVYDDSAEWYLRGKFHRKIGPADTLDRGSWYTLDKLHRLDGPAYANIYAIRGVFHSISRHINSDWLDSHWAVDGRIIRE